MLRRALAGAAVLTVAVIAVPRAQQAPAPAPAAAQAGPRLQDLDRARSRVRGIPPHREDREVVRDQGRRHASAPLLLRIGRARRRRGVQAVAARTSERVLRKLSIGNRRVRAGQDPRPAAWCRRPSSARYSGQTGSLQLWVENVVYMRDRDPSNAPDTLAWNRQVYRWRVWDNLIANIDRNQGNLLLDPVWNLILIDHSRAFTNEQKMPFAMIEDRSRAVCEAEDARRADAQGEARQAPV